MENLIFTLISNVLIITLFINLGLYFRKLLVKDLDDIIEFTAVDLILGFSISIFFLFILSKFIGFKYASYILLLVMLLNKYNLNILKIRLRFISLILLYFVFLFLNFQNNPSTESGEIDTMATFNLVAHSVRAANLSIFINNNDFIPGVNQNIFQSIVASFLNNFSTKGSIQFNFSVIMAAMPITTFLMLSLILKSLGLSKHRIIALICMFINSSISTYLITVNDGGSSLFNTRSFDIFFSICCFLLILYCMLYLNHLNELNKLLITLIQICVFTALLFAGPQFLMFISCFSFLIIFFSFVRYKYIPFKNLSLMYFFCLLISGLISMTNGGFFILQDFRDLYAIPGIGGLWDDALHAHRRIGLRTPYFLCYAEYGSHVFSHLFGNPTRILPWPQNQLQYGLHKLSITETIFYALCTIRFVTVPVISIIVSYFLLKKINILKKYKSIFYSFCFSALIFSFFYLFIEKQLHIWPLSRFFHPILIICIISSGYILDFTMKLKSKQRILIYPLIVFLVFPGLIHFSNQIYTSGIFNFNNFQFQFIQTEMIPSN